MKAVNLLDANFLFASLIWGSVGAGYFIYGKRQQSWAEDAPFGIAQVGWIGRNETHARHFTTGAGTNTVLPVLFIHALMELLAG